MCYGLVWFIYIRAARIRKFPNRISTVNRTKNFNRIPTGQQDFNGTTGFQEDHTDFFFSLKYILQGRLSGGVN